MQVLIDTGKLNQSIRGACVNCRYRAANKRGGLCIACRRVPSVALRYAALKPGPKGRRNAYAGDLGSVNHPGTLAAERKPAAAPTSAMPGSAEKIQVLTERCVAGQELWHPGDNLGGDD